MEPLLLAVFKATGMLVMLSAGIILFRASLRVFHGNIAAAYAVIGSAAAGLLYFLFTGDILAALFSFLSGAVVTFWIWTAVSLILDRKAWAEAKSRHSYDGYLWYLNRPKRLFHRAGAIKGLRTTLEAQLALFSLLRKGSDAPASRLPKMLGTRILESDGLKKVTLALRLEQDFRDLHTAYRTENERRDLIKQRLGEWRAEAAKHDQATAETPDAAKHDLANAQIKLCEELLAPCHALIGPRDELDPANLSRLRERFRKVCQHVFGLVFPPELLVISVLDSEQTEPEEVADFRLDIRSKIKPAGFMGWIQPTNPPVHFTTMEIALNWAVAFSEAENAPAAEFEIITVRPTEGSNTLGLDRSYAYLILRGYADFAWELLREMGFVQAKSFYAVAGDARAPLTFATLGDTIREKLLSDFERVAEAGAPDIWYAAADSVGARHEEALRRMSQEIETFLAREMQALFEGGLDLMSGIAPSSLEIGDVGPGC